MKSKNRYKWFIVFSIFIITLLHYFTLPSIWAFHDFYRRLYYIPIILAAFKFKLKGAFLSSISVILLYAPHLLIYFGKLNINVINQLLEASMFIIIGGITGALVESESRVKRLLELQITKLTDLENYTENILNSILEGVVAIDGNLKIQSINKEGKHILCYEENLNKKYIYEYFEEAEKIKGILSKAMEYEGQIQKYETYNYKNRDQKIILKIHGYPLLNNLNKLEGMVLIIEDITQIEKLEHQIRRADKLSAVGELASGIAHEVRNPLGIIKTITQTISKEIKDEEMKEGLQIIESEIDRANKVIQGLLDFAKPSVFHSKHQSIDKIITDVVRIVNKYAEQHKVRIQSECVKDEIIFVDADILKQAFVNIIINGIQAMSQGGKFSIRLNSDENWVKISFTDEGLGIDAEKLEKVFEPFFTTKEKGTGLGLAITHRIIEEHGGYIEIESTKDVGTTIDVYLPKDRIQGDEIDEENTNR
ncbi:two-component system sensor histidine kinase NtrB [Geosporobacter ferrireducens]|uniref:histidine kinase n=1 Tax=Geosporobacter ferrireducens TaxID=1424294 RepID=A0A1D8GE18_9FIRM|nr:ATP-binding protein [Geosporobacter ferrireducens]AOT69140.1 hypothetical protein Gferi_05935 [Geosporobacter ferrireducens]MTI56817.1 PAS domain S-box protein [Geosporobacter ferrireducens]